MESFKHKSPEELNKQTEEISRTLGEEIAPPFQTEEAMKMSSAELKEKFPRRYEIYLNNLRGARRREPLSDSEKSGMATCLNTLNSMDLYIETHKSSDKAERTLYEHQFEVFEVFRDFLEKGNKEGYIKLPTGTGKTALFSEFLEATDLKSLIVVPTNQLLKQTEDSLKKFAPGKKYGKINKKYKEFNERLGLTTYASLRSQADGGEMNPQDYDCLILDEAHMALGPETKNALAAFPNALKIGFTATPNFTKEKSVAEILKNEIYNMPVWEAVEKGLLCEPKPIVLKIPEKAVDLSNVKITAEGNYNERDLEKIFEKEETQTVLNMIAMAAWDKNFVGKTGIAYCVGIKHSEKLAEEFNKVGISAMAVSGETTEDELVQILKDYKDGKIQVLCNADLLIQGFDEPKASVCLNLRPTMSAVNAEQRGGRVLRLDEESPDKIGYIVDFLYKTKQGKNHPILYQEVLGGTAVERARVNQNNAKKEPRKESEKTKIIVNGIEIPEIDDLVEIWDMVKEIKENGIAGREWRTEEQFIKELDYKFMKELAPNMDKTLEREIAVSIADSFRALHPDWFGVYSDRSKEHRKREHYRMELAEAIMEDYRSTGLWMNRSDLAAKLKLTPERVYDAEKRVSDSFKSTRIGGDLYIPGVKITVRQEKGSKVYYSPRTAELLVEELKRSGKLVSGKTAREIIESVPPEITAEKNAEPETLGKEQLSSQEWRSIGALVRDLNNEGVRTGKKEIRSALDKLRGNHPKWFREIKQGKETVERYSPELFEEIKSVLSV